MQHVCKKVIGKKVILQESNKGKCQYANTKFLTAICQMRLLYTFIIKKRLMKLQVFFGILSRGCSSWATSILTFWFGIWEGLQKKIFFEANFEPTTRWKIEIFDYLW